MQTETFRASVVNWEVRPATSPAQFFDRLRATLATCEGSELVVLPEFCTFDLLALGPQDSRDQMAWLAEFWDEYVAALTLFPGVIVGGSSVRRNGDRLENVSPIVTATGVEHQAKLKMTQFEQLDMGISPGGGLRHPDGLGVLICYDSEFPEAGRALAEAGAWVLAVPAFTETIRGFQRVRWSCQARAIENQIYVLHASLVGSLGGEPVPVTYGSSAILAPSVAPFPESAVLAETAFGVHGVEHAELSRAVLEEARNSDDVRNWHDRDPNCWRF